MSNEAVPYRNFFNNLTGQDPFPYQERLQAVLALGHNVILRAPTGAGKTWSTVAPFLFEKYALHRPFADRLLYVLPLRSLASSLHQSTSDALDRATLSIQVKRHAKERDYQDADALHCSLQMGGHKNDPFFEGDITFTTIDQFLSAYLMMPVSLPSRLDNMVAGAIIGSYVVIDEAHLLDSDRSFRTLVEMFVRLKGLCRFVLMTATMSTSALSRLAAITGAIVFDFPEGEIRQLPSQVSKQRTWKVSTSPLSADAILNQHRGGRSIAIVNTVSRSQALFEGLTSRLAGSSTRVILLHSRFYPEHREQTERMLGEFFGPAATRTDVILVTTQVVEAGVDISAENLHTELAPMNALVQRAGRCARYRNRPQGTVTIYEAPNDKPYDGGVVAETRKVLYQQDSPDFGIVDFAREQQWVDQIHAAGETSTLRRLENTRQIADEVNRAIHSGERGQLATLVREIDSVQVFISSNPGSANFSGLDDSGRRIGWPTLLGIPRSSLRGLFGSGQPPRAPVFRPQEPSDDSRTLTFEWQAAIAKDVSGLWLAAIHPDHAVYDRDLGLVLGRPGPEQPLAYAERPPIPRYQYAFETWTEHSERVRDQYRQLRAANSYGIHVLAAKFQQSTSRLDDFFETICELHDAGKLADEWQSISWSWQREKDRIAGRLPRNWTPIAHTDFDPGKDRQAQKLPPHALAGAYLARPHLYTKFLDDLAICGVSAIARHHAPRARSISRFVVTPETSAAVKHAALSPCVVSNSEDIELIEMTADYETRLWPLYAFAARILRLADQASLSSKGVSVALFPNSQRA